MFLIFHMRSIENFTDARFLLPHPLQKTVFGMPSVCMDAHLGAAWTVMQLYSYSVLQSFVVGRCPVNINILASKAGIL
jgi:hypothetical protein